MKLPHLNLKYLSIAFGPILFVTILLIGKPSELSPDAFLVFASTCWVVWWWMTEAIPIGITSLLPLLLLPLCGVLDIQAVASYYANPIIFLFIGGFIIALAMERWDLHRRIALNIVKLTGTNQRQILLGFIIATGIMSMWISNTATTMMMLPIGLSMIYQFETILEGPASGAKESGFGKALILSIAYAASIGGIGTLVGTPTNLIFVEFMQEAYQEEIAFDRWFYFAFPLVVILSVYLWWHMSHFVFKLDRSQVPGAREIIGSAIQKLDKIKFEEKWVLAVFIGVGMAWMSRAYLIKPFFPQVTDTTIALVGGVTLFLIPSRTKPGDMIMNWEHAARLPWQVILLFGGAFAVAGSFQQSGLTTWIGNKLALMQQVPFWVLLLIVVTVVNYLTELTQNMATCTLMLPVLAGLSQAINVPPHGLMIAMTMAASCAFMLPVATAPNAIVFGSRKLAIKDMIRAGFWLNIISILVITFYTYYFLPILAKLDVF